MFSCASPDSAAMIRNAASTRSAIALSAGPAASGAAISLARSLIARQASGEKRSRMTEAAKRALPTRRGSDPSRSVRVSTARAMNVAGAGAAAGRNRVPGGEQRADAGDDRRRRVVGLGDAVDDGANQPQRRLGALHVASDPEQIVGGAARQQSAGALHRHPLRGRQQRGLGHRAVRQHPGIGGRGAALQADRARIDIVGDAHEAGGQHLPAFADPGDRNSRSVNGRGCSRPSRHTGMLESVTASCAT